MSDSRAPGFSRRSLLAGAAALPFAASAAAVPAIAQAPAVQPPISWAIEDAAARAQTALAAGGGTKLVLLGTGGGPIAGRARRMTSNVMVSEGKAYILDAGLGVTNQFGRTGLQFGQIESIFITHMHPDHMVELLPLMVIGWMHGLRPEVVAYGPPPLQSMIAQLIASQQTPVHFWAEDFHLTPLTSLTTNEITGDGPVMHDERVSVHAVLVEHPPVHPAFGYRFDFKDRSIAFSGDTVPLAAVARMANGADVLVHEAMYMPAVDHEIREQIAHGQHTSYEAFMAHMLADHSKAEDVGRIATEAGVKTLVLSHLTPSAGATDAEWRAAAARNFAGEILVGHDLMVV